MKKENQKTFKEIEQEMHKAMHKAMNALKEKFTAANYEKFLDASNAYGIYLINNYTGRNNNGKEVQI